MINQITAPRIERLTRVAYWIVTILLCLNLFAGLFDIMQVDAIRQSTQGVGFPLTMLPFLGSIKIIGGFVILFLNKPVLKIAAYAGTIFYFLGAIFAHLTIGQPFGMAVPAFVSLMLAVGSYLLWRNLTNVQVISR